VTVVGVKTPRKPNCWPLVFGSLMTLVDRNCGFCGRQGTIFEVRAPERLVVVHRVNHRPVCGALGDE